MAIATTVVEVERESLEWLLIQDDEGKVWRYTRGEKANPDSPVDVDGQFDPPQIRAVLVQDLDGTAKLRQDGPGLPKTIVVNHVSPAATSPTTMFWKGKVEYHQEPDAGARVETTIAP